MWTNMLLINWRPSGLSSEAGGGGKPVEVQPLAADALSLAALPRIQIARQYMAERSSGDGEPATGTDNELDAISAP